MHSPPPSPASARTTRRRQSSSWSFRLGVVVFVILLVVGLGAWRYLASRFVGGEPPVSIDPDLYSEQYRLEMHETAGEILARYMNSVYPGKRVLVLMPPESMRTLEDKYFMESLHRKLRGNIDLKVDVPDVEEIAEPGLWFTPQAFDAAVRSHPTVDVVVSVAGLPVNEREMTFWRWKEQPDLILFNASVFLLRKMIAGGAVDAALVRRPWKEEDPPDLEPRDVKHWVLVTPQTIDEVSETYPGLFYVEKETRGP
ncbi:MAG: hypothetical protein K9N51_07410 [Candidatus Pacebacteria bacterium]|nr:hypothetical protein [Candidatus Paceibacterota bacterium]